MSGSEKASRIVEQHTSRVVSRLGESRLAGSRIGSRMSHNQQHNQGMGIEMQNWDRWDSPYVAMGDDDNHSHDQRKKSLKQSRQPSQKQSATLEDSHHANHSDSGQNEEGYDFDFEDSLPKDTKYTVLVPRNNPSAAVQEEEAELPSWDTIADIWMFICGICAVGNVLCISTREEATAGDANANNGPSYRNSVLLVIFQLSWTVTSYVVTTPLNKQTFGWLPQKCKLLLLPPFTCVGGILIGVTLSMPGGQCCHG